jgi:hypothetical protein
MAMPTREEEEAARQMFHEEAIFEKGKQAAAEICEKMAEDCERGFDWQGHESDPQALLRQAVALRAAAAKIRGED